MALIPAVSTARSLLGPDMFSRTLLPLLLAAAILLPGRLAAQEDPLRSRTDPSLVYPIRVVEATPYLRPGTDMAGKGDFRPVHRELGTLSAERLRLPVPGSTWRLDGRVVRTEDGTLYAGFGTYLYRSDDDGRSWTGRRLQGLPNTRGEPVAAQAFGAAGTYILVCHAATTLQPVMSELVENPAVTADKHELSPLVISRSSDGGEHWESSRPLSSPPGYRALAGDGNSIIALGDGTLLAALDAYNPGMEAAHSDRFAEVFFRSRDQGLTWGEPTLIRDTAAETGLVSLGGLRVLAAIRGVPNSRLGGKTIQLANSDDGGRSWRHFRPLTRTFGQAHGTLASLPGGGVVAVYENRYPYHEGGDVRARVSWDGGGTWEPEVYILMKGHGYGSAVAGRDGTIITVAGDSALGRNGRPDGRGHTLQAVRWKPWPKSGRIVH